MLNESASATTQTSVDREERRQQFLQAVRREADASWAEAESWIQSLKDQIRP